MKVKNRSTPGGLAGSGILRMVGAGRGLKQSAQWVAVGCCSIFPLASGYPGPSEPAQGPPAARVTPNRTVPQVAPPKTALESSASPTAQEVFRAQVFAEPLVPIGGEPSPAENAALAAALLGYAKRSGSDDFSSLTGFLATHPTSPWRAALLTDLGLEYYNTAHYSLALDAWEKAWPLAKDAMDRKGKAIADRVAGELASMYARLGRMTELEALLKSVAGRAFVGAATEKITGAREGLWMMQNRPEVSFKCGPYALQRILASDSSLLASSFTNARAEITSAASTQKGMSLPQVAELSKKIGLNYQMAFRGTLTPSLSLSDGERAAEGRVRSDFIVPSVVHWKVGHYAAMVRQEGDRYLLEDPTFGNAVWATRQTLEAETSGYFLILPGELPPGWRSVDAKEGASVWGKGTTANNDDRDNGCDDEQAQVCRATEDCPGMAASSVHLMLVSLNIKDTPVGYSPPVGPPVKFTVRYNQREAYQPANFTYSNFGSKWTCDWISYITDNPSNLLADVNYFIRGGGTRTFTGFDTNTQTFAFQQYDQTQLKRTGSASYEMLSPDGSKKVFSQSDGSIGTSRKIFLTQILDPFGNAVALTYDGNLRIAAIADAIGQVTTLTYSNASDIYKITRVTDPFGRFADFTYDSSGRLTNITDVIGLNSRFIYTGAGDFISSLITPYGTNTFIAAQGGGPSGTTRSLETIYPDGSRDRVEYNQSNTLGIPNSDPSTSLPTGMSVNNQFLYGRNTFYWSRTACASSYGDYTKAKIYHWLHTEDGTKTSGILESTKEALEGRIWYNYPGQPVPQTVGTSSRPTKVGRVLDDGQTQLFTYAYDGFGHVTSVVDPMGRTFSYIYSSNGIDLLGVRQTRSGNNELISASTYNNQHLPLTITDTAGRTTTFTYSARGQVLTAVTPNGDTNTYTYDTNGYLLMVDGPLPGTNDLNFATYDAFGRTRSWTDESGYTVTFDYDAMDRMTRVTHPDSTFEQFTYDRLDLVAVRDRAGRQTLYDYNNLREMKTRTDPLGRVTRFEWCRCGAIKSLTDPMGRTTSWLTDVQSRPIAKQYPDGSQVTYLYENASSRPRQIIDEKGQITQFTWNRDNTLKSIAYANATVPTSGISYTYDPDYDRLTSMTDGAGTTLYSYNPISGAPTPGAGQLASEDGPLPNDTITYDYDGLGRRSRRTIAGIAATAAFDAASRLVTATNPLGGFAYTYDGSSPRPLLQTFPNGQTDERSYGNNLADRTLQKVTYKVGATPISEYTYDTDVAANRIVSWSQQAGAQLPLLHNFGYDAVNQLLSDTVTNAGVLTNSFAYIYDPTGNRLVEQAGSSNYVATYNALNQISTTTAPGVSRTNEWDAQDHLVAVNIGNERTEFTYDGEDRMVAIRKLQNGSQVSYRRLLWCDDRICEERDAAGTVTKRFFSQGMKVETGPNAGNYYYTRDHLGSIRELTDGSGNVRARYAYDPYGRQTRLTGDMDADFGFAGMFSAREAGLNVTHYRAYDAELGRWLSRDPLPDSETEQGPNLYTYVADNPVNAVDPLGLCCEEEADSSRNWQQIYVLACARANRADDDCERNLDWAKAKNPAPSAVKYAQEHARYGCKPFKGKLAHTCQSGLRDWRKAYLAFLTCADKPCKGSICPSPPRPQPLYTYRIQIVGEYDPRFDPEGKRIKWHEGRIQQVAHSPLAAEFWVPGGL
jgi:RHS repeat-associated protein